MTKRPLLLAFLLAAFLILVLGERGLPASRQPELSDGETVTLTGIVEEIAEKENSRQIRLSHIYLSSDLSYQRQVLVYENQQTTLKIGYKVKAAGSYAPLEEASNPGQFDQKAYYEARGIGMVLKKAKLTVIEAKENIFFQKLYELRSFWAQNLEKITGKEEAALLKAMLLGEKSGLKKEQKELYQSGGISHILAISGLHISLVGMLLYRFLRKKKRSYPFSALVSGSCMVVYGFLTGFGVSAKRAVFMFLVYLGAELLGETYDVVSALALSGLLILAEQPLQLFQCGFQLSFLSVGAVALVYPALQKRLGWKKKAAMSLLSVLSVTLFTLPCTLYWFYEWMPYAVFLNLIVIPLVPVVFLSGAAGMLTGGVSVAAGMFLAGASAGVLRFFQTLLERTEVLPGSRAVIGQPELWRIALYYVLVGAAVWGGRCRARKKNQHRIEVRIFFIIFALCILCLPFHRPVEVTFLDVGQGDAGFLRTEAGTTCLIDGGSTTVSDVGTYRLLPFLKSRGVSSLDYLFLSHMDADHINGAEELLKDQFRGIPIRHLCLSALPGDETRERLEKEARLFGTELCYISRGTVFREKGAEIRCLSPVKDQKKEDENENSEVLMVEISGLRILFTGDLGEEGEQELLEAGTDLRAAVLKVGHHGSRFSTGEDFLEAISPGFAVISCAEDNRYGHPAPETVERLERAGCRIFYTMKSGAVTLYPVNGKKGWKLEQKFDRIERGDSYEHS
ncbi:DNA internalization-related competence protein ComEC/Rec2 [Blautia sp. OF03-15BH]|uniref:DNA internalization-related competence protein ComEC/Rec2 n=1 Tax=Blautia sp. OF03-15BH TaxID=2292287 RepID=UPI000E4C79B5|nr:DNA internalization-related competence protein ComEC/Rec2 [Blautia sp. OF03-15BH]RGY01879.1 DNA internalization-related competence protein ComEC/Rec2 [Blautia sp. OF03-15BH]